MGDTIAAMAWKAALLTGALTGLALSGCTVPSSRPHRAGYSVLGGVNIGVGTAAGLAITCGIIDILQGNRRHRSRESDKFYGQCATVGLGVAALIGVGGGIVLYHAESDEEPTVGEWALVSAPTAVIASLGAVSLVFHDKEEELSIDFPVSAGESDEIEEEGEEERGLVVDCTGQDIRASQGAEELVVKSLFANASSCDVQVIDLQDGAKTVWITERNYSNVWQNSNVILRIEGGELELVWQGNGEAELGSKGWWIETLQCLPEKAQMVVTRTERSLDGTLVEGSTTTRTKLIDLDRCLESMRPSR